MTVAPRIGLIWAQAEDRVIGRDGAMPWHVPEDLAHFRDITLGSSVVMGRATWDSLSERYRPLPGRRNIVITRQPEWSAEGAERAGSVPEALQLAAGEGAEWVWVIGGGEVFAQAISGADRLEVTLLTQTGHFSPTPGDVRAPAIDPDVFVETTAEPEQTSRGGIHYRFVRYERAPSP